MFLFFEAFLVDESGSVSSDEWEFMTDFVDRVIQFDISTESSVALWEYASKQSFEQFVYIHS